MNGNNVLLVEDSLEDSELFIYALKGSSLHVEVARNAAEAERLLKRNSNFCFAFVDMNLPDMEGTQLVRRIKDGYPHIPICVLTGSEDLSEHRRSALADCGAIFMFVKPFTSNQLKGLMNMLDMKGANFASGRKLRPSWWTSIAGIVVILAGVLSFLDKHDALAVGVIAAGVGLLKAQDASAIKDAVENLGKKKES